MRNTLCSKPSEVQSQATQSRLHMQGVLPGYETPWGLFFVGCSDHFGAGWFYTVIRPWRLWDTLFGALTYERQRLAKLCPLSLRWTDVVNASRYLSSREGCSGMLNDVITQMVDYVRGLAHWKRESPRPIHAFWYEQEVFLRTVVIILRTCSSFAKC